MSTKDYIEFVTMQIMTYLDLPAEEKKQRRQKKRTPNIAYIHHWFGILPFSFRIMLHKYKKQAR